jgi:hypothetical protein
MKTSRAQILGFSMVAAMLFCACSVSAQAPLEPSQMPANTAFYLIWRGAPAPAGEARKVNSLFALWDDADFAPARAAMADSFLKGSDNKTKISREELNENLALLENAFVVGYLGKPKNAAKPAASGKTAPAEKTPQWDGFFLVYDRSGKVEILSKAMARMRATEKEPPQISEVIIGGIKAQKIQRTSGVSFWMESGKYAVAANERAVAETVLARLTAKTALPDSLSEMAAYREAQPLLGSGLLEFFVNISNAQSLADESSVSGVKVAPLIGALKLGALHSLAGHVTLEGAKTHVQGALLGDASAGTLFDLWGEGQAAPASLSFVPADAISYTSSQINFMGIYALIKQLVHATFPQTQQGNADMIDTIAQAKLGMPVPDALGLFTGEFGAVQTDPKMESSKQFFWLGTREKAGIVKLIHAVATDNIVSEKDEGATDFLKLSLSANKTGAANIEKNSWRMAVTQDAVLFAANSETLHRAIAGRTANSSGGSFAATPQYSAVRAKYPEKLIGLSFYNFEKVDWAGLKERWIEESRKAAAGKSAGEKAGSTSASSADWMSQADPQVFARHLHFASGGWWKDSAGIHFEEWLE